jgi:ParB-like chromosome segregation protein Spo0J
MRIASAKAKSPDSMPVDMIEIPAEMPDASGAVDAPVHATSVDISQFADMSKVILAGAIARVFYSDIYTDENIAGRLGGRNAAKFVETKQSIAEDGQVEPIAVGLSEAGVAILYSGFGRHRAIKELHEEGKGDGFVSCVLWNRNVKDGYLAGITSNTKREDLNPMQMAGIIETLSVPPFSMKAADVSVRLGIAPSYVRGLRKLIDLPDDVQSAITDGKIGPAQAIAMARNPEEGARIARKQLKIGEALDNPVNGAAATDDAKEALRAMSGQGVRPHKEVKQAFDLLLASYEFDVPTQNLLNGLHNYADGIIGMTTLRKVYEAEALYTRAVRKPKGKSGMKKGKKKK